MIRPLLILAAAAAIAPSDAHAQACTTATPECTEWVAVGTGAGRSLVFRSHVLDVRNESITRVLVMVHGAGRNADGYFSSAMAAAFLARALENTLVISPRMASNDGQGCRDTLAPNEISWHCNTWRSGGPALTHPAVTSFDFMDAILRKVARKQVFPNLKVIVVTGHSAGGQVTNRYQMTNQVHDKLGVPVRYIVSNPSSYAWPSDERPTATAWSLTANAPGYIAEVRQDAPAFASFGAGRGCTNYNQWSFGLVNRTGYSASQTDDQIRKQLASRPTVYLLGELDILPLAGFDGSCSAMAQGPTRLARGQAFAKYVNEKLGAKHDVVVVPMCGHNARCMYTADVTLPLLFPEP
ncbi:MAG: hypothetical protein C0497_07690 [Gemmatimonas sp.]|nr:hypothetical protein [Gemmatimonas sp.]